MKVGILTPLYDTTANRIADFAGRAEQAGLDGVFVFDGAPYKGRQAFPVLDALDAAANATSRLRVGTLVARAGDERAPEVENRLKAAYDEAGSRLVAGLGVGDAASFEAEGRPVLAFERRLASLEGVASRLTRAGAEVWLGGRSEAIGQVAADLGLSQNLWEPKPGELEAVAASRAVSWGGRAEMSVQGISETLRANAAARAEWCIFLLNGSGGSPEHAVKLLAKTVAGTDNRGS